MAPRLFIKFLSKAIYCSNLKPSTYATCYLLELCQIVVTLFERCISYSHDQDHVHSTYFTNFYTGSCASIPQNKKLHDIHSYSLQVERTWASKKNNGHMKVQSIQRNENLDT